MHSGLVMPVLIAMLLAAAAWKRLPMYDLFVRGAGEGIRTAVQVLPNLAAMMCAISLMQASGLLNALCSLCAPAFEWIGLPAETAPLVLIRPMSGSGALAMLEELLKQYGPDSRTGLIACTLMGAGETVFYVLCVYMSGMERRQTGYAVPCSLVGMAAGVWLAGKLF